MTDRIEIISHDTGQVVHTVDVPAGANADRLDRGINVNLNHEQYYTRLVDAEEES